MAIDRARLQQQMTNATSGRGGVTFIKSGKKYRLRFLEFTDSEGKTDFARLVAYWQKNRDMKSEILNRQVTFGATDAVARLRELCDENGVDFPYDRIRKQYYANGIDMDKTPHQVRRFGIPTTVWEQIVNLLLNDQWANVLEPDVGHGFEITSTGSQLETQYTVVATRDPWPVDPKLLAGVCDPLADVKDPGLAKQCEMLGMELAELFPQADTIEDIEPIVLEKPAAALSAVPQTTAPGNGSGTSTSAGGVDFRSLLRGKTGQPAAPQATTTAPKVNLPFANKAATPQQTAPPAATAPATGTKPPITSLVQGILNRKK